jgi:hypothetical protein
MEIFFYFCMKVIKQLIIRKPMNYTHYLYGASVQGIQNFIFQTNELRSIAGASELVEQICSKLFNAFNPDPTKGTLIVHAAGNIKCEFYEREDCAKVVREFPKKVLESVPGVTISQAVVKITDHNSFPEVLDDLECKLHTQRNKPMKNLTLGLTGILRSRTTGLPVTTIKKVNGDFLYLDEGTYKKWKHSNADDPENITLDLCKKSFNIENLNYRSIAFDLSDLTKDNDWIAIIHADGNNLGKTVSRYNNTPQELHRFSENMNNATKNSAQQTYKAIIQNEQYKLGRKIPFRPVVLGGDDMTMICRGDLAMEYTRLYLKYFEEETNKLIGEKLTACAGIAYIKSSYPFYYGYKLAEELCEKAKDDSKSIDKSAPSCLMFHKVQSSFIEKYDSIVAKELTPQPDCSFKFGPYYLNPIKDNRWTIDKLQNCVQQLQGSPSENSTNNAVKSDIRKWMSILTDNKEAAEQMKKRVESISGKTEKELFEQLTTPRNTDSSKISYYPAYDVLSLFTVENQKTKL